MPIVCDIVNLLLYESQTRPAEKMMSYAVTLHLFVLKMSNITVSVITIMF